MKVGLIGFGNIARKHFEAVSGIEGINVAAICEQNKDVYLPEQIPGYSDPEDMYAQHPDLDIVSVCTPNGMHEAFSTQALEKGFNVICEKPLSLTTESCLRIKSARDLSGKQLICVMQNRYSPVSQWLKKLISENVLGKIFMVNVSCYWNRNAAYYKSSDWRGHHAMDGGTLFTQFSHYVDSLYWLFGRLKISSASFSNFNHGNSIDFEDSGIFSFSTPDGAMGSFNYTTATYQKNFESTFTIIAEKGTIKIAGQYMDTLRYCDVEGLTPPDLPEGNNIRHLSEVYRSAVALIRNGNGGATSLEDGTEVVRIIEDVYRFKN